MGKRGYIAILASCLWLSWWLPTANAQSDFSLGVSAHELFPPESEYDHLALPLLTDFNQTILSDPVYYQAISGDLGGEFLNIASYDGFSRGRTPTMGFLAELLVDQRWRFRFASAWTMGTLSRDFSALFFDPEAQAERVVNGLFEGPWNATTLRLTGGYQTKGRTCFFAEAGGIYQFRSFKPVEAMLVGHPLQVSANRRESHPGVMISTGLRGWAQSAVAVELNVQLQTVFQDESTIHTPGIGLTAVWQFGRRQTEETAVTIPATTPTVAEVYVPDRWAQLFEYEQPEMLDFPRGQSTPLLANSYPDGLDIMAGASVQLPIRPAETFVLYPEVTMEGRWDTATTFIVPHLDGSRPYVTLPVPNDLPLGLYALQMNYQTDEQHQIALPLFVREPLSSWIATMSNTDRSFFLELSPDIDRWRKRVRDLHGRLDSLRSRRDSIGWKATQDSLRWLELVSLDRRLDHLTDVYKDEVTDILDSLERQRAATPGITDREALEQAVAEAGQAVRDCQNHTAALEEELKKQADTCDALKAEQDAILEQIHQMFIDNGFTGSYGYHADGRYYYGYSGESSQTNTDFGNLPWEKEVANLKKDLKKLNSRYRDCRDRLEKLPDLIAENRERCAIMEEARQRAEDARSRGEAHAALEASLQDECAWFKKALEQLADWCAENPGTCDFMDELEQLLKDDCPGSRGEWTAFWDKIEDMLAQKKELEDAYKRSSRQGWDDVADLEEEIDDAGEQKEDAWDAIRILQDEEARRIREQKAAARDEATAAAAEEKRKREQLNDCLEQLAAWIRGNQDLINPSDRDKVLSRITSGAGAVGQGALEAAEKVVRGGSAAGATITGVGVGAFHLGAAILYMIAEDKWTAAANRVVDSHIKNRIEAEAVLSDDPCGVIDIGGDRSYFYMKINGKTVVFSITPNGFECHGVVA
jgi:predicted  nucleic acid-binding Zn-ribbon protein